MNPIALCDVEKQYKMTKPTGIAVNKNQLSALNRTEM